MSTAKRRKELLHFDKINQCHAAMGFSGRTDLPDFHIFTLAETYPSTRQVMPPYTLRFYAIVLLENSHDAILDLNTQRQTGPSELLSFQAPGHVSAWVRGAAQQGFVLYFQPEFLSHHGRPLPEEFPFLRINAVNFVWLTPAEKAALREHFVHLVQTFHRPHPYRVAMLQALLLALLFDCKAVYERAHAGQAQGATTANLATRFQQLLEQHYLTHQSVQAYATLLHVTPNHLSHAVSVTLGRTAGDLIAERLLLEAKKLLHYTDLPVVEIADYLGFAEPTHFSRFFKHQTTLTPLAYRRQLV